MINLLPPQYKKELLEEETKRLIIILGIVILAFLVSTILILFSIEIYLWGQVESQKTILTEAEREFEQSDMQILQEKVQLANLTFSQSNSFYQGKLYFIEILEKISQTLPRGAYLTNISLSLTNVSLSGFAETREILFDFKKNLEAQEDFQEIYFPPANWVKPVNIDFNVTFKITK